MRRGFNLVEVLIVAVTIPIAAIVLDMTLINILRDIPRSSAVVQENITLLNMLEQLHKDVDEAKGLPESFVGYSADDNSLLIELSKGVVCYHKKNGEIIRGELISTKENGDESRVWSLPNCEVAWQVWRRQGKGYAVEVTSHVKLKLRKKYQKKMANSHLFFVDVY